MSSTLPDKPQTTVQIIIAWSEDIREMGALVDFLLSNNLRCLGTLRIERTLKSAFEITNDKPKSIWTLSFTSTLPDIPQTTVQIIKILRETWEETCEARA